MLFSRWLAGGNESGKWPKESSKTEKALVSDANASEIKE